MILAAILAGGAQANPVDPNRNMLLLDRPLIEVPAFDARQRRLDFQYQQQQNREDDRLQIVVPQKRPPVPRVQPNCPAPVYGNDFMRRTCP